MQRSKCGIDFAGVFYPWRKLFPQQLGNEGARYDHALIHEKIEISQPCLVGEVSGGNFLGGAALDDVQYLLQLCRGKPCIEKRIQPVERKMERVENEISRFIVGRGGAMAEKEPGLVKAAYRETQQVADSLELSSGFVVHKA